MFRDERAGTSRVDHQRRARRADHHGDAQDSPVARNPEREPAVLLAGARRRREARAAPDQRLPAPAPLAGGPPEADHEVQARGRRGFERHAVHPAWLRRGERRTAPHPHVGVPARVQQRGSRRSAPGLSQPVHVHLADVPFGVARARVRHPGGALSAHHRRRRQGRRTQRHVHRAARRRRARGGGRSRAPGRLRPQPRRRRRALVRRLHGVQPAGARARALRVRGGALGRVQPHAHAFRVPVRGAHAVGGQGDVPGDESVHARERHQEAHPADSRRGGHQQRDERDPERALLRRAQGERRGRQAGAPAARVAQHQGARERDARARGDERLPGRAPQGGRDAEGQAVTEARTICT
mmetsp:Transcript_14698/g.62034  ORF Transcript_14698/g.62034 Transcript_14698/m.62034 type:complete len:354 (+) Transcript_14698:1818-2879(+)